jgi:hypothetical protein
MYINYIGKLTCNIQKQGAFLLNGSCHDIFDLRFFHQTTLSEPLIHGVSLFAYNFIFAEVFFFVVSGVNDTVDLSEDTLPNKL